MRSLQQCTVASQPSHSLTAHSPTHSEKLPVLQSPWSAPCAGAPFLICFALYFYCTSSVFRCTNACHCITVACEVSTVACRQACGPGAQVAIPGLCSRLCPQPRTALGLPDAALSACVFATEQSHSCTEKAAAAEQEKPEKSEQRHEQSL